ncbi:mannose-1-phosphate guanylyltransferase/mannose-6-phosphate isomerase [Curvivirga sp.]|uniref:mannose-1-phosphate guanylyltransferase/mannose-6-phosphate isomerase n=1 Tax=Curvivirga sp. TaxID=2856848 RepID=UPI003B5BAB33
MDKKIYPVILSGGAGSRLWPTSRRMRPKQFLPLYSDQPMLIDTVERVLGKEFAKPTIVCSEDHRFLVAQSLQEAKLDYRAILLEPVGRDTAAAISVASLHIHQEDPEAIIFVLPSDHIIENQNAFSRAIEGAALVAQEGYLTTFGIVANSPETAFGYIKTDGKTHISTGCLVDKFVEKPDAQTAKAYIDSGEFYWNSGMFMFKAETFLLEMVEHAEDIILPAKIAVAGLQKDLDFQRLSIRDFEAIPKHPIDKALMEKTSKAAMVPLDAGWSDIGSWTGLWEASAKDKNGNALRGKPILEDVKDSIVHTTDESITAVMGLNDVIVVNDTDALLVASMDYAQNVKDLVSTLNRKGHNSAELHATVYRPWGNYRNIGTGDKFLAKIITVYAGCSLSLQYHNKRAEHWVVVQGQALVTRGDDVFELNANESTYIAIGQHHRLENKTEHPLIMVEVQTGDFLEEDDIVRLDDVYGRDESK